MNFERSITRYGHGSGYTSVFYTSDEETFVSAGKDGDIHIWKGIEDDDPSTGCTGEFIASLAFHDNRVYVGTDVNTVQMLTYPDLDRDGIQYRFTEMATAIRANDNYVAAGSEDTHIKVYVVDSSNIVELLGHKGPILALDITQDGLLASSSGDGTLKVWHIKTQTVAKTLEGFDKVKSFEMAECFVTPCFSRNDNGKYLCYAKGKEVVMLETENWTSYLTLTDDKVSGNYSVCGLSACGKYVAAGTTKGELSVWRVIEQKWKRVDGKTCAEDGTNEPITSLQWNVSGTPQFVFADKSGQLGCVNIEGAEAAGKSLLPEADDVLYDDLINDNDDDEDDDNCVSLEKLKNDTMRAAGLDAEGHYLDDEDDDDRESKSHAVRPDTNRPQLKLGPQQKAFQSGATPHHLEHRYMAWNEIGIVRCHKTDTENSVEAEFHDASMHHGIHMTNFQNHTLAALSGTVLALAGGEQCKLVCIALGSGSREWSVSLPDCEEVVAIAASDKVVAVGTDARFVRLFSCMGNQREMISMPGPIVAMASQKNKLIVVYHSGIGEEDQQHLSALIVDILGLRIRSKEVRVPLTAKARLTWLGYSDCGSPVTLDSYGMMRAFKGNLWVPICDTAQHTKGASDNFFVIEVSESKQIVRAVLCRGTSFPQTHPRPMVNELPIQMPLCEIETEKSQWEDKLIRSSLFEVDQAEQTIKEMALKLFALACRSEVELRARDLIEMIGSTALIPLAAKYANKLGRIHLAEKLGELLPKVMDMEREEAAARRDDMQEMDDTSLVFDSQASVIPSSLESPVIVAPKLMKPSSGKRNPFKKSLPSAASRFSGTNSMSSPNPIKHLTDSIVGLPSSNVCSPNLLGETETTDGVLSANKEPAVKASPVRKTFIAWFEERKAELSAEMPESSSPAELTAYAMKKYKTTTVNGVEAGCSFKRKLDEKENENGGSGVAKLAKFRVEA